MEYHSLKKYLITSIFFSLVGCNTMDISNKTDEAIIKHFMPSDILYTVPDSFFGYKNQQSYYVNLGYNELNNENFKLIGKFVSNDNKVKLKIKELEAKIKSNNINKAPPNIDSFDLIKGEKIYQVPFIEHGNKYDDLISKLLKSSDEIKNKIYNSNMNCEYCFEPSVDISKNGEDYTFNLKLKNMGSNDFDLDGISALTKPERTLSIPALSIFLDQEVIQLDKNNLLNNNYLYEIKVLKNETITIPFIIHSNEIPQSIKNKDLTKENLIIALKTSYKSGELNNQSFMFSIKK